VQETANVTIIPRQREFLDTAKETCSNCEQREDARNACEEKIR